MTRTLTALGLAIVLAGCGGGGAEPDAAVSAEGAADAGEAFNACMAGDTEAGIAALDAVVDATDGAPDPLVLRGLCHWTAWDASGDEADVRRAYADLTAAIEAAEHGREAATPIARMYSHRAFVARALDGEWARAEEDLDRAVALEPGNPTHALDRGVVRSYLGDTSAAVADLRAFLDATADSTDAARRGVARALLDSLATE